MVFDSKKEGARYQELKLLDYAGKISDLQMQVQFDLLPATKTERGVKYIADFVYIENGNVIVEDTKGLRTRDYVIKRKIFKLKYPDYEFRET